MTSHVIAKRETKVRRQIVSACILSAATCFVPAASDAAVLAYEGFDYEVGALGTANGGTGWGGAWSSVNPPTTAGASSSHSVAAGSMTYSNLVTGGNQDRISNSGGSTAAGAAFRNLAASFTLDEANPVLWLSFMGQADNTTTGGHAGVALFNGTTEFGTFGKRSAASYSTTPHTWSIGLASAFGAAVNSSEPANVPSFLVYKFTWTGATSAATAELWVNPELDAAPTVDTRDASTTANNFTINRVRVSTSTNSGNFDEIRLGTTFEDVAPVPEPTSVGLVAAGAAALLARRRRRS
jgi:hypothetical protein